MARLSPKEKRCHRQWFEEWRTPTAMVQQAEYVMNLMGSIDQTNQGGADFLTHADSAGEFANLRSAEAVRLVPERDQWPDFQLLVNEAVEQWELTETHWPGRRMADEYQKMGESGQNVEHTSMEECIARTEQIPEALRDAVRNKLDKNYDRRVRVALLIDLQIPDYGIRHETIKSSFAEATAEGKNAFSEIWILWKSVAYPVWVHGVPARHDHQNA